MMRALEPRTNDMDLLLWRHAEAVDGSPVAWLEKVTDDQYPQP